MGRIKKLWAVALLLCATLCFAGCGEEKLVSQDLDRANTGNYNMNPIMKTDKGFYYSQGRLKSLSLYYHDAENGKGMYLCNKPECRHEGDEFCAATSDKYKVMETVMYSGSLYINAVEETETTYKYKLLRASLDGSSLSEVVTYFETENIDVVPLYYWDMGPVLTIHRNKAFLPYQLENRKNKDTGMSGTAIYDLETGELTYLGEKTRELEERDFNFIGCGDYMYYVLEQKYKTRLYRYCYTDGSVEMLELEKGFKGDYAVYDENTVFYIKSQQELYKYTHDTKESIRVKTDEWNGFAYEVLTADGLMTIHHNVNIYSVLSDGEYVYVPENFNNKGHDYPWYEGYNPTPSDDSVELRTNYFEVTILDADGNYVNHVEVSSQDLLGYTEYLTLHILGDTIYMQTPFKVYECSKADFIAGNANFKEAYSQDIGIYSVKENE